MAVEDACNYLTDAAAVSELESFMIFGGEPMLYPERAIAIIKKAHEMRIPKIEMITNGVWGKDGEAAEKLAIKLKTAGLNTIHIGVDAFHLQYLPIEYPRNAALASLKADIESVTWNVAVIESIGAFSPITLAIGMLIPPTYVFQMFLGAALDIYLSKKYGRDRQTYDKERQKWTVINSGLFAGEGVILMIVTFASLLPLMFGS
jgi:hypothetical protein